MRKTIRFLTFLLTTLMLLQIVCSCKKKTPAPVDIQTNPVGDESLLEAVSYDRDIHFMTFGYDVGTLSSIDDLYGDYNGNVMERAVFQRNAIIEEKYDVSLISKNVMRQKVVDEARLDQSSGKNYYNLLLIPTANAISCGIEGFVENIYNIPHLDLTQSYWYTDYCESTQILEKNFFIIGDMNYTAWTNSYCIYFNEDIATNWQIDPDEIYDLVRNGKWTFEKFAEYSSNVYVDSDGVEGKTVYDTYGFYSNSSCVDAFLAGADMRFVTRGEQGKFIISFSEQFYSFYEQLCDLAQSASSIYSDTEPFAGIDRNAFPNAFVDNRAMFACSALPKGDTLLRNVTFKYTFIPLPKYDESQQKYYSWLHQYNSSSISYMKNGQDFDMLGRITEDMAFYSRKHVRPAYYERLLENYLAYAPIFVEMLNYCIGSYSIDMASVLAEDISLLSGAGGVIRSAVNANSNISNILKRHTASYQTKLDEIWTKVSKLPSQ